jgi:hypothetical protein
VQVEGWSTAKAGWSTLQWRWKVDYNAGRLEYCRVQVEGWNTAGWRLFYGAGGRVEDLENNGGATRLKYSGGRLEYCAGRLDYSTVKVEGRNTVQEKDWSAVQGGWSLYSARRRLEHGAGVRLEYGIQVEGYGTGAGRPEYCKIHVEGWSTMQVEKAEVLYRRKLKYSSSGRLEYFTFQGEGWSTVQVEGYRTAQEGLSTLLWVQVEGLSTEEKRVEEK